MKQENLVVLEGRLVRAPEVKSSQFGTITNITLAHTVWFKAGEEWKNKTSYIPAKAYGKQAESIAAICGSGDFMRIHGMLELDQWEVAGQKRSQISIRITSYAVDRRSNSAEPQQQGGPQQAQAQSSRDDDLPF